MIYYPIILLVLIILIIYIYIYIQYNLTYIPRPSMNNKTIEDCELGFVKSQDQINLDYIAPDIDYGMKNFYKNEIFD